LSFFLEKETQTRIDKKRTQQDESKKKTWGRNAARVSQTSDAEEQNTEAAEADESYNSGREVVRNIWS
jgi:hypothetical protein